MAERLSVTTAVIGLLAVGGKIMESIWDLNLPATEHTPALVHALQEVKQCRSTVHLLYKTLSLVEAACLPLAERAAWIAVDDLIATLTDTVLAFSDLQVVCDELSQSRGIDSTPNATAGYGQIIGALCSRIRWQSLSMNLMTTILKCPGEADAHNARAGLRRRLERILTCDTTALSHRMRLLQGLSQGGLSPPHYSPSDREPSRGSAPRPAPADSDPDRGPARSPFSGYALGDIPVMSIVSLPVTTNELRDGSDVYTVAYARRMGRHLGQLAWGAENQNASKTIEAIRGRTDGGKNSQETNGAKVDAPGGAEATRKPRFYSIRVRRRGRT